MLAGFGFSPIPVAQQALTYTPGAARLGVPIPLLTRGQNIVPPQAEPWTCGISSGARFAAMLGQTILDYQHFLDTAPYYLGWRIGPVAPSLTSVWLTSTPGKNQANILTRMLGRAVPDQLAMYSDSCLQSSLAC